MNTTTNLGLKKPQKAAGDPIDIDVLNDNSDIIDNFAATTNTAIGTLESGLSAAQSQIAALQGGVHLKGSVNYYADLPEDPDDGDAYTVLYFGTSGQEPAGIEYAWVDNSQSWIPIGVDPAAFAKPADITAAIAALDVADTGGAGKYISTISETNGKISATPTTFDTALSSSSTDSNAPTTKTVFDDQQRQDALEAEDRAALVQQVDSGAKNLFDFETWASSLTGATRGTITIQNQSITLTATGNDAYTTPQVNGFHIPIKPNTEYVITAESADSNGQLVLLENDAFSKYYTFYTGVGILRFKTSSSADRLSARFGVPTSGNTSTISNVMICTAQDWAVSQKFVPYAMSNAELTAEVKNITPTIIKDQSTSVGTSYTLISSLTQTTTAGKLCKISAIIAYRNYRPRGIVLSYSNDSSNFDTGDKLIAKTENTGDTYELSASAIISRNNVPVYVWAKAATAGAEHIYSIMEQLGDL